MLFFMKTANGRSQEKSFRRMFLKLTNANLSFEMYNTPMWRLILFVFSIVQKFARVQFCTSPVLRPPISSRKDDRSKSFVQLPKWILIAFDQSSSQIVHIHCQIIVPIVCSCNKLNLIFTAMKVGTVKSYHIIPNCWKDIGLHGWWSNH